MMITCFARLAVIFTNCVPVNVLFVKLDLTPMALFLFLAIYGGTSKRSYRKEIFFHALPGNRTLSFGMLGCDFYCSYCQNWFTSQSLRDDASTMSSTSVSAKDICDGENDAKVVVSTYNEPLITSKWAVEVFKEAKQRKLWTTYV
jgi:pyruvate formate lyase activating enzyme